MRYFLTKLTFNNHFDWLYMGNGKFCFFREKKVLKSNQVGNILSIVTFSVFYGDLNYISVCLFEGFLTIFWNLVEGVKVRKWRGSGEAGINFNLNGGGVSSDNAKVGTSSSSSSLRLTISLKLCR